MNNPISQLSGEPDPFHQAHTNAGLRSVSGGAAKREVSPIAGASLANLILTWRMDRRDVSDEKPNTEKNISPDNARAPQLIDHIIKSAIKIGASDIKFAVDKSGPQISFSINGTWTVQTKLSEETRLTATDYPSVVSRLMLLAGMDISKKQMLQDGAAKLLVNLKMPDGKTSSSPVAEYKIRMSTNMDVNTSSLTGSPALVMRLLSTAKPKLLDDIMPPHIAQRFREACANENGIILCTGPTGSGKTTTLYSILGEKNDGHVNILTAEDPVEYEFPRHVLQTQVAPQRGITFATAMRGFLRQKPDIILVGEIRDQETLETAIEASLTGHLVFSTLHTNDAPSTIARLLEFGAEDYLLKDTVRAIVAQRLVPTLCDHCKVPQEITTHQLEKLDAETYEDKRGNVHAYECGKGCESCHGTGIGGRTGVYELMVIDDQIRSLIFKRGDKPLDVAAIRRTAIESGMGTIAAELANLVAAGMVDYKMACRTAGVLPREASVEIGGSDQAH